MDNKNDHIERSPTMADKKRKPIITEEEKAAQRAQKLENDRKLADLISQRTEKLRSVPGITVLTNTLSVSIPIHVSFLSLQDVVLYVRNGSSISRIRKGDLIQLCCSGSPKSGMPVVAFHNGTCIFAVPKDDNSHEFFNLSSKRPEDDNVKISDTEYIGNIVFVVSNPASAVPSRDLSNPTVRETTGITTR